MKILAVVLALLFCFSCQPLAAQEEKINVNYVEAFPQMMPQIGQYAGVNSLVLASGMVRTPGDISLVRAGFKARMIYPEVESEWSDFGVPNGEEVALRKPLYDYWWREESVGMMLKEKRSGIYEYYVWTQFFDEQGIAHRYRSTEKRMAYINDPEALPAVICREIKNVSLWYGLYCRADVAIVGMPLESYNEVNGRGCYLYFDIYQPGSSEPIISRNAGRIEYGWKSIGVVIPRYEFEEKNIVAQDLVVKTRIVQAVNENVKPSYYGFSEQATNLRKFE